MREYDELMVEHQALQKQLDDQPDAVEVERVRQLIAQVRDAGESIGAPQQREQLRAILKHWGAFVYDRTGDYPPTQLAPYDPSVLEKDGARSTQLTVQGSLGARIRMLLAPVVESASWWVWVVCGLAVLVVVAVVLRLWIIPYAVSTPTAVPSVTLTLTPISTFTPTPSPVLTTLTPTPSPVPSTVTPTLTSLPPTFTPTATPTLEITLAPPADPPKDVGDYYTGAPVQGFPAGVDIRDASVDANLRVMLQPTTGVPAELSDWVAEEELLLWISLYDPVPDPPSVVTDWLFALDLDGVLTTGRPPGTRRIDPDLGDEVAIGVSYNDVTRKYEPYFLVWDPALVDWSSQPEVPRFILSESRTLIGLALPLEALKQSVEQISGVTIVPEAVKGRAGVTSRAGEQRVIDFYPELPD